MTRSTIALFWTAVLITGLLVGCDLYGGPDIDEDITAFVRSEPLPDAQTPSVEFRHPTLDVKAFEVEFQSGCVCPSGCLYSTAYGLEFRDRIGWMHFASIYCLEDSLGAALDTFDVRSGDHPLFGSDLRETFRSATKDRDPGGYAQVYEAFLRMLARDVDTPMQTLRSLADLLYDEYLPGVAQSLIQNPSVRSDTTTLKRLTDLPNRPGYCPVIQEAQELLRPDEDPIECASTYRRGRRPAPDLPGARPKGMQPGTTGSHRRPQSSSVSVSEATTQGNTAYVDGMNGE